MLIRNSTQKTGAADPNHYSWECAVKHRSWTRNGQIRHAWCEDGLCPPHVSHGIDKPQLSLLSCHNQTRTSDPGEVYHQQIHHCHSCATENETRASGNNFRNTSILKQQSLGVKIHQGRCTPGAAGSHGGPALWSWETVTNTWGLGVLYTSH